MHLRPFVDLGYVFSDFWDHGEESSEFYLGAATIIYIDAIPSLAANVDWGRDLKRNLPELIIDTRHYL